MFPVCIAPGVPPRWSAPWKDWRVERVELNLLTGKMTVLFEKPDSPAMERIAPVVEKVGFRLADWKEEPLAGTEREERLEQEETGGSASFGPFCCWFL